MSSPQIVVYPGRAGRVRGRVAFVMGPSRAGPGLTVAAMMTRRAWVHLSREQTMRHSVAALHPVATGTALTLARRGAERAPSDLPERAGRPASSSLGRRSAGAAPRRACQCHRRDGVVDALATRPGFEHVGSLQDHLALVWEYPYLAATPGDLGASRSDVRIDSHGGGRRAWTLKLNGNALDRGGAAVGL